jgi:hypothetical protein
MEKNRRVHVLFDEVRRENDDQFRGDQGTSNGQKNSLLTLLVDDGVLRPRATVSQSVDRESSAVDAVESLE